MIDVWLQTLAKAVSHSAWLAPLIALFAGILTSFTPCSLSSVPLIVAYIGGAGERNTRRAFAMSASFAFGMSVTITALGAFVSALGKLLHEAGGWWYILLGILMVLMAIQTWGIYEFLPHFHLRKTVGRKGYFGAFLAGLLGGIFSSHCATPVLVALLAMVAGSGKILWGIFLLLLYSIGHSALVVTAGTSAGVASKIAHGGQNGRMNRIIRLLMGVVMLFMAVYLFSLAHQMR